ncbi:tetratricopeptide repeat protein [bacterium]|nr:tetratricopeptide repeat protein [bacterium]
MIKRTVVPTLLLALLIAGCAGTGEMRKTASTEDTQVVTPNPPSDEVMDYAISGSVFESAGEYRLALHEYKRGLMRDSTQVELYHAVAEMATQLGRIDEARTTLEKGARITNAPTILTHLGELQLDEQLFEDAVVTFEELMQIQPDEATTLQHLAVAYERTGKTEKAAETYDRLLELPEVDPVPILMRKVSLLSSLDRLDEAVEVYQQLQTHRPEEDRIPFFIGGLYLDMGDTTRAVESIAAAATMRPVEPRYWDMWIRLEVIRGNEDRAITLADSGLSYNPVSAPLHALAASVYMLKDQEVKAESALKRAIQLDPEDSQNFLNLGFLYHEQGRFSEAEDLYEDALKLSPGDAQILNNFAYLLAEQGTDLDRALELSEDALSLEPENASFLDTKGWIYYQKGQYDEAITYLERAAGINPEHYEILEHLGDVYAAMGNAEKAREMWQRAIDAGGDEVALTRKLEE